MSKIFFLTITCLILLPAISYGQVINLNKENIYVDQKGKPYSGVYKEYFDNGKVKLEMKLKKGFKNGKVSIYFENGNIHEIYSYKNNQMDGLWLTYNEKGIKTAEARYLNDRKNGEWKVWDDNGTLIYLMYYTNGAKSGTWIKYNEKGEEIAKKTYEIF